MSEDRFKEILEEIFDIKIELIQAFSDLGKKFDNLMNLYNAKSFFLPGEKSPAVGDIPERKTLKKESTKKLKVTSNALITGIVGIITEKAVKIHAGNKFAWIPKKAIKNLNRIAVIQEQEAALEIEDWFIEKVEWKS